MTASQIVREFDLASG